jgi:Mg2+ and Co2+ transporter CorA
MHKSMKIIPQKTPAGDFSRSCSLMYDYPSDCRILNAWFIHLQLDFCFMLRLQTYKFDHQHHHRRLLPFFEQYYYTKQPRMRRRNMWLRVLHDMMAQNIDCKKIVVSLHAFCSKKRDILVGFCSDCAQNHKHIK